MTMNEADFDPVAIYGRAEELHRQGAFDEAIALYEQILERFPDADVVLYNYGLACYTLERYTRAVAAFRLAAQVHPDDPDTWYNLGLSLKQCGQYDEAEASYRKALSLKPADEDTLYNLACCCKDMGAFDRAVQVYEELLVGNPEHPSSLNNLAYLYHLQQDIDQARGLYERLLRVRPHHPSARHMLASLNDEPVSAPPTEYVRDLFDQYSDSFEDNLINDLGYRTPHIVLEHFEQLQDRKSVYKKCVDLGCGTGLAGVAFRPYCEYLVGVDLSRNMLAKAGRKLVYDDLAVSDVLTYMTEHGRGVDLLLATDVLIYLGDLQPLFQICAEVCTEDVLFCFSTESTKAPGWELQTSGRYAHNIKYIRTTAAETGWQQLDCSQEKIRREYGQWIMGNIVLLRRSSF